MALPTTRTRTGREGKKELKLIPSGKALTFAWPEPSMPAEELWGKDWKEVLGEDCGGP